ncbi:MAG TPA: ATP-binding protein [Armatimonadota bacterium]|jgi:signal transduction histidine kinase
MLQRAFTLVMLVLLVLVVSLTTVLLLMQSRHSRILEGEVGAVRVLEATYQASMTLDRQRVAVASSTYLPLDHQAFKAWGDTFKQRLQGAAINGTPDEQAQVQRIQLQYAQFMHAAQVLPPKPSPVMVQGVQDEAETVTDLLEAFRVGHSVNLSALFVAEHDQRALNVAVLLVANGAVLIMMLAGLTLLARLGHSQADMQALRATDQLRGEFISFAAHELRNPASAIKTGASMLREPDLDPALQTQVVDSINRSAEALTRVVMNLLNMGRIEAGELRLRRERITLDTLVNDLVAELEIYHPGIEKRVQRNLPDVQVFVDPEYIKLALSNVLDNAIKYSPPGSPIAIAGESENARVTVHVRDMGSGIPSAQLPHIFDKFETSGEAPQSTRRGIGLGLYMMRLLVEAHGGTVWAESTPGQGTTISFSIPRV